MKNVEKFWDKVARSEAKQLDRFSQDQAKILAFFNDCLTPEQRVLDFACGSGKIAQAVAPKVQSVAGIDISSGMVAIAQQGATQANIKNATFFQATIFDPRLKPGSFDVILACNILHLVDDPSAVIDRIAELLAPGGLLLSSTGVLLEKKGLFNASLWLLNKIGVIPNIHFYKSAQLQQLITTRFNIVDSREFSSLSKALMVIARKS